MRMLLIRSDLRLFRRMLPSITLTKRLTDHILVWAVWNNGVFLFYAAPATRGSEIKLPFSMKCMDGLAVDNDWRFPAATLRLPGSIFSGRSQLRGFSHRCRKRRRTSGFSSIPFAGIKQVGVLGETPSLALNARRRTEVPFALGLFVR